MNVLLTDTRAKWDDARPMGTPRNGRGGGGWRKRSFRAAFVALTAVALIVGMQAPARADDPLQDALRRKEELERAVAQSRANAERYKVAANQFQAAEQQQRLVTSEDLYAKHLRTTYRQALVSPLEMLLSSKTLTEFASRVQA